MTWQGALKLVYFRIFSLLASDRCLAAVILTKRRKPGGNFSLSEVLITLLNWSYPQCHRPWSMISRPSCKLGLISTINWGRAQESSSRYSSVQSSLLHLGPIVWSSDLWTNGKSYGRRNFHKSTTKSRLPTSVVGPSLTRQIGYKQLSKQSQE